MTRTSSLSPEFTKLRQDLSAIVRSAIAAASPARALDQALSDPKHRAVLERPLHVIAAGKAAASMVVVLARREDLAVRSCLAVGTHYLAQPPHNVEWHEAAHPLPDARSMRAGLRAQAIAANVRPDEGLLLLVSGGASALLALPADDISLDEKGQTVDLMMRNGAGIHELNVVRKHLSKIKGGQLAASNRGTTLTLAVSDVMDDDVSVIASGPGVADSSTWADAASALRQFGGSSHPRTVRQRIEAGCAGRIADTPKTGDPRLARATGRVIVSRREAIDGAVARARALGYQPAVLADVVIGQARTAASRWLTSVEELASRTAGPLCVISAGETTVHVKGTGRGGRNQEFALALADAMRDANDDAVAASVGTDGIDGPTDAAGAFVDRSTIARAARFHLDVDAHLEANNSFAFFEPLDDLIRIGRTDTNVGDLQIYLRR